MSPRGAPTFGEWGTESRIAAIRRWRPQSVVAGRGHTRLLLKGADRRTGLQVLDLGCGAGVPALDEARRVGPRGHPAVGYLAWSRTSHSRGTQPRMAPANTPRKADAEGSFSSGLDLTRGVEAGLLGDGRLG